jgi:hypothetical protein
VTDRPPDPGWSRDPGWREAILGAWVFVVPGALQYRMRRADQKGADGLILLRSIYIGFASAIVFLAIVISFMGAPSRAGTDFRIVTGGLVVVGGVLVVVVVPRLGRQLECTSLAGQYRTRFFLRVAVIDAIAMASFVLVFAVGSAWIYYIGAAIALFGFVLYAPNAGNLARDQADLRARGCDRSLIEVLRRPPDPSSAA